MRKTMTEPSDESRHTDRFMEIWRKMQKKQYNNNSEGKRLQE